MPFLMRLIKMRETVTTFCILTPLPWKNVVTGLRCSVTTVYGIICYGILAWKCGVSSHDLLPRKRSKS